jgi:hypothetical protein
VRQKVIMNGKLNLRIPCLYYQLGDQKVVVSLVGQGKGKPKCWGFCEAVQQEWGGQEQSQCGSGRRTCCLVGMGNLERIETYPNLLEEHQKKLQKLT